MTGFYTKPKAKWDWRAHLTQEERDAIAEADAAKKRWMELNNNRAGIVNRAIQRAKYAAERQSA